MDALDIATELQERCRESLRAAGHGECEYLERASYNPEAGAVVCGCGVFVDMIPGAPPAVRPSAELVAQPPALVQARDPIEATLALIDPAEQYTPVDVERHILEVLYRLETGALFERETIRQHHLAEVAFERAYWRAHDASQASAADRRKADAMTKCEAEHLALMEAKYLKEAAKQTMHNLRAVLSGYQSTARSVGAAYQAGGSNGRPY